MTYSQFEVDRNDLNTSRLNELPSPELGDGQVRVRIDLFALTANNITYGVVGERIGYWKFFPAEANWGLIPVWGFADVIESNHADVPVGDRLYGYFPMATEWILTPDRVQDERLQDGAAHRAELPPVYNNYSRTLNEPHHKAEFDDDRALLMPLYATSYCLYDYVCANDYFNSDQVVITSASSKTSIGCAYAFKSDDKCTTVGLTSEGQLDRVNALNLYDEVYTYSDYKRIDAQKMTTIIDMSGNGDVLSKLHEYLGDSMAKTSNVGLTHYESNTMGPHFIRERSEMFFAPGHMQRRAKEWGPGVFGERAFKFWLESAVASRSWLTIDKHEGADSIAAVFTDVLDGKLPADHGVVVEL
ncbi:MAG: DUF2855 family protein [Gammaproteobacteria bacterium]